eukprot:UN03575
MQTQAIADNQQVWKYSVRTSNFYRTTYTVACFSAATYGSLHFEIMPSSCGRVVF